MLIDKRTRFLLKKSIRRSGILKHMSVFDKFTYVDKYQW